MEAVDVLVAQSQPRGVQQHRNRSGGAVVQQQVFVLSAPVAVAVVVFGRKADAVPVGGNPKGTHFGIMPGQTQRGTAQPLAPGSGGGAEPLGSKAEAEHVAGLDAPQSRYVAAFV